MRTTAEWQQRRAEIIRGMETVMGAYPGATSPKRVALDLRIEEEIDRDTYIIRRISYQSEPGSRTPAFLCIPKAALVANTRTFPVVLCLHPTDQTAGACVAAEITGTNSAQLAICPRIFASHASPPPSSSWSNHTSTPAVLRASQMRFAASASWDA